MTPNSSMTPEEEYRLTGTLRPEMIEVLLDDSASLEGTTGVSAHLQEAMCQYPAEDFLADAITRLQKLAKRIRGDNREALLGIIESLDDVAQCTFNAVDYGRDELSKALKAIGE